ncbi:MAG: hypothetical protein ACPGSW_09970, partial [Phaeobacter italicus]
VMFFAAFFGALYYLRVLAVPWLAETELLWPGFEASWPSSGPAGARAAPAFPPACLSKPVGQRRLIFTGCA